MNLAKAVTSVVERILRDTLFRATVTAVSSGKARIQRAGESVDTTYYSRLFSYDPVVSDEVVCLRLGGGVIILGAIKRTAGASGASATQDVGSSTQGITTSQVVVSGLSLSLGDGNYVLLAQMNAYVATTGCGDIDFLPYVDGSVVGLQGRHGDPGSANEFTVTLIAIATVTGGPKTYDVKVRKTLSGGSATVNRNFCKIVAIKVG